MITLTEVVRIWTKMADNTGEGMDFRGFHEAVNDTVGVENDLDFNEPKEPVREPKIPKQRRKRRSAAEMVAAKGEKVEGNMEIAKKSTRFRHVFMINGQYVAKIGGENQTFDTDEAAAEVVAEALGLESIANLMS